MNNSYDGFSKYYSAIIRTTGRLQREEQLMSDIIHLFSLEKKDLILDAACGTGDALNYLFRCGFENLEGLDLSKKMIDISQEKLPKIRFYNSSWEELKYNIIENKYKFIYIISVSFLHAQKNSILSILKSIYNLLLDDGVFLFDSRNWGACDENGVIQHNRVIGQYKKICHFELDGHMYLAEDKCTYTKNRQNICYKVSPLKERENCSFYEVNYARISSDYFERALLEVGFKKVEIQRKSYWPYILISAYK